MDRWHANCFLHIVRVDASGKVVMKSRELKLVGLTERLVKLERLVRRWRNIGFVCFSLLGMAVLLAATGFDAAPTFDAIRARELNILDSSGKIRAFLRVGKDDSVALALVDTEGRTRASLALLPDGTPRLRLYEQLQNPRAGLEIGPDGAGAAALATSDGTLYFETVNRTMRELPPIEGVRLRKAVTVSGMHAAPADAYRMVDAERAPAQ